MDQENDGMYRYRCRCGDDYELTQADVAVVGRDAVIAPCRGCSNHALVRLPGGNDAK